MSYIYKRIRYQNADWVEDKYRVELEAEVARLRAREKALVGALETCDTFFREACFTGSKPHLAVRQALGTMPSPALHNADSSGDKEEEK